MDSRSRVEQCFKVLDQSSTYLSEQLHKNYLEALIDTAENLFQEAIVVDATDIQIAKLNEMYQSIQIDTFTKEELRKAFQLATLKGMKEHAIPGTGITPDTVAMFIGYLAKKLVQPKTVFDPAVGSANLLTSVLNQYEQSVQGVGTEVDPTLVRLAYVNANLQKHQVELFHQDGLKPLYTEKSDLTVCDLPIGIYPNQKVAQKYELFNEDQDDTYTHHLLVEQSIQMTTEDGYLIFLIPNTLFNEPGSDRLRQLITEKTYIQAIMQLPDSLFQKGSVHKSIFILQKKGENSTKPKQTLMVNLPTFSDPTAFNSVLKQINEWMATEVKTNGKDSSH